MLKPFILYVINTKSGTTRDIMLNAGNSYHARTMAENMVLRKNEKILSVYPYKYN